jgi:sec-independent protein translocase protein TatB
VLNLDPSKLLIIAVVAVILLGPDRLPQVARQVGAAWRTFGEFRNRMESEVRNSIPDLPSSADIARLARSPSALLNHLSNMAPDEEAAAPVEGTAEDPAVTTPTSADPPGDELAVPGSSDTPDASPGPTYTPTDPMPPTPSTRPLITPENSGPVDLPPQAPPAGDPGLN